jgi:hypothetical protein
MNEGRIGTAKSVVVHRGARDAYQGCAISSARQMMLANDKVPIVSAERNWLGSLAKERYSGFPWLPLQNRPTPEDVGN